MEHIDAEVVSCVNVCTILDENLAGIGVALERSEVEGCEAIAVVLLVDPGCDVIFYHPMLHHTEKCFETLQAIVEGTLM